MLEDYKTFPQKIQLKFYFFNIFYVVVLKIISLNALTTYSISPIQVNMYGTAQLKNAHYHNILTYS